MTSASSSIITDIDMTYLYVLLDRFVSASTGDDVSNSLQAIYDTLQTGIIPPDGGNQRQSNTNTTSNTNNHHVINQLIDMIIQTEHVLGTLLYIYHTSLYPKTNIYIEDGIMMVGQIYQSMIQKSQNPKQIVKSILQYEEEESISNHNTTTGTVPFIEVCIDIASASSSSNSNSSTADTGRTSMSIRTILQQQSSYPRVLSIQLIQLFAFYQPSIVQTQLLNTPNGIHRLGDLLKSSSSMYPDNNNDTNHNNNNTVAVPEQVQLAMIELSKSTLSKWSSVAKIWIFHEIIDPIVQIIIKEQQEQVKGGNNSAHQNSNMNLIIDCYMIVQQLLSHDTSLAELVLQSSNLLISSMIPFIDLRNGLQFRFPSLLLLTQSQSSVTTSSSSNVNNTKSTIKNNDDDLDDLIASVSNTNKNVASNTTTDDNSNQNTPSSQPIIPVPMLTNVEEQVIQLIFDLLCNLLDNPKICIMIRNQYNNTLCTFIWEMALLTKPISPMTYTCAIPSILLQQRALHMTGTYLSSLSSSVSEQMKHKNMIEQLYSGYDRLFYLVCTGLGGSISTTSTSSCTNDILQCNDQYRISQSSLYVVRQNITHTMMNDLLMYTLVPPPQQGENDDINLNEMNTTIPQNTTIVSKLLHTIYDNIIPKPIDDDNNNDNTMNRLVCLSGALGALTIFMTDDVHRSILYRITNNSSNNEISSSSSSLIHTILDTLVQETSSLVQSSSTNTTTTTTASTIKTGSDFVAIQLLRFLCTWVTDTPEIVVDVFKTTSIMTLSQFVSTVDTNHDKNDSVVVISVLLHLLFGLCLHSMDTTIEQNCGGWTRHNIVLLLQQRNTMIVQQIHRVRNMKQIVPWSFCPYEWNVWTKWYNDTVHTVRQCIIQELVLQSTGQDSDVDDDVDVGGETIGDTNNNESMISTSNEVTSTSTDVIKYRKEIKMMKKIVSDLTQETDTLRTQLQVSETTIATQGMSLNNINAHA
jgi:hypothetical protein